VADQSVIATVQQYLVALGDVGVPVTFGVLFGSQVTGKADHWSDLDILVVSPHFDAEFSHQDVDLLWHVAARVDSRIEPLPCGERQWREDGASPLIEMVRREGEVVALPRTASR
jgi:predicted nucleotidyltransferase